mmetsp:Transcript_19175/g.31929  ORF Transcript_19175/g.31929 Transcript_19175/m.31929 type:complete len:348 (-) Transcript_19175:199-1242(-)
MTQEEKVDLELDVDVRQTAGGTENVSDHLVSAAERGVDVGSDSDQASWHGVLEVVGLSKERHDHGRDGRALDLSLILLDNSWADLDRVSNLEDTLGDTASSNTTTHFLDLSTGLVDVKGADDDHAGRAEEVSRGDGDLADDVLVDDLHVVAHLGRDGDDGGVLGDRSGHELFDLRVLLQRGSLSDEVDFVLQDHDVLELHDFDGSQVLRCLRLRATFVGSNEEEGGIHDGSTVQHGGHEDIVSGTVDKADVTDELHLAVASLTRALGIINAGTSKGLVAIRTGTAGVETLEDLCVGVTQFDGDVSLELVGESDGLHAGDGLHDRTLSVRDVADGSNVDGGLTTDDFG